VSRSHSYLWNLAAFPYQVICYYYIVSVLKHVRAAPFFVLVSCNTSWYYLWCRFFCTSLQYVAPSCLYAWLSSPLCFPLVLCVLSEVSLVKFSCFGVTTLCWLVIRYQRTGADKPLRNSVTNYHQTQNHIPEHCNFYVLILWKDSLLFEHVHRICLF